MKAVNRTNAEIDLLCAPWRGREEANSPILRLDERTVNAGSQKSKREGGMEKLSNEQCTTGWKKKKRCQPNQS